MKIKELKELSEEELKEKHKELNKQLMELQFKRRSSAEKPHLFKLVKKDIARIMTVFNQKKGDKGGSR